MATIQDCYTGRVIQREYTQEFDLEYVPNYTVVTRDGVEVSRYISSYTRNLVTAKVVEQTFRFIGLTRAQAFSKASITVTDIGATSSFTFVPKSSIVDGSSGSRVMIVEDVVVLRTPVSPHLWELVVTRKGFKYYVNGTAIALSNTPAWIADYV